MEGVPWYIRHDGPMAIISYRSKPFPPRQCFPCHLPWILHWVKYQTGWFSCHKRRIRSAACPTGLRVNTSCCSPTCILIKNMINKNNKKKHPYAACFFYTALVKVQGNDTHSSQKLTVSHSLVAELVPQDLLSACYRFMGDIFHFLSGSIHRADFCGFFLVSRVCFTWDSSPITVSPATRTSLYTSPFTHPSVLASCFFPSLLRHTLFAFLAVRDLF